MGNIDPETGIWNLKLAKKRHHRDDPLCKALKMYYKPERAADVGCGNGSYCAWFTEQGWPVVHGYEGTKGIVSLGIYEEIYEVDLSKPLGLYTGKYDFVLCIEVGEHIPKQHERQFIDNVCEFVSKDLVLSWAIPGQYSASGHVNLRNNKYVIKQFEKRGMVYDEKTTNPLRKVASFGYFKNTLMVFRDGRT